MALTKCPACNHEVSDQATACPNCGQPLEVSPKQDEEEDIQTIQLTKKKWKKVKIFSVLFFVAGLFFMNPETWGIGLFLWFVAFVLGLIAAFGAWWSTG